MRAPDLTVFRDADEVARAATERFYSAARLAVRERGRFVVSLAGGETPRRLHRRLGAGELRMMLPWSRTTIVFGDERCVAPDDERSNYRMVRESLLDHVRLPDSQVVRIEGELDDPDLAASRYEQSLRRLFPDEPWPRLDLAILGLGVDGHTASLFPGSAALEENERWAVADRPAGVATARVTLTVPVLRRARQLLFLVTGSSKASALAGAFETDGDADGPVSRIVPFDGGREFLVDRAAAARLPRHG